VSASGEQADLRLYTLGEKSQRTGMFGLPLRATIIAGIAFIVAMLVLMQGGLGAGALIAVLAVAYLAPAVLRIGNRTLYEVAQMRWQFWRAQAAGSTVYRSGPNSRVPGGRYRLPGALAKTELHVGRDVAGNDFALIRDRALNQYTVLLDAASRGQEPLTVADRNDMTAEWGAWLAELSLNDDVVAATVTVESYPTTGQDLIAAVKDSVSESTPEIARRIQAESAVEFARGKLVTRSWIAVTFKAATAMQRKDPEAMATDLGFRLPGLYQRLEYAGVSATPMNPEDAIGLALRCYRPDLEETTTSRPSRITSASICARAPSSANTTRINTAAGPSPVSSSMSATALILASGSPPRPSVSHCVETRSVAMCSDMITAGSAAPARMKLKTSCPTSSNPSPNPRFRATAIRAPAMISDTTNSSTCAHSVRLNTPATDDSKSAPEKGDSLIHIVMISDNA